MGVLCPPLLGTHHGWPRPKELDAQLLLWLLALHVDAADYPYLVKRDGSMRGMLPAHS